MKNKAAQELGRLGRGVPKRLSKAEIKRRTARLLANRYTPKKKGTSGKPI